jgi:uncharacterized phage protein (TIGR01671 family)
MREYLFRGKDKKTGEWRYGYYVEHPVSHLGPRVPFITNISDLMMHQVGPDTVGQYTGLKDKAGVRIFEGDIVLYERIEREIRYHLIEACFKGHCFGRNIMLCPLNFAGWVNHSKIIGNIHDTPELLTGGGA